MSLQLSSSLSCWHHPVQKTSRNLSFGSSHAVVPGAPQAPSNNPFWFLIGVSFTSSLLHENTVMFFFFHLNDEQEDLKRLN